MNTCVIIKEKEAINKSGVGNMALQGGYLRRGGWRKERGRVM